jgi:D-threo-aldose 1-dehydrogenase
MAAQPPVVAPMPERPLGRRGPVVSLLGLGGAPLGDLYARLDDAMAVATVAAALDAGITLLDTAPLYGRGLSEHRIGAALRRRGRERIVLSTKVGRVYAPARPGVRDDSGYLGGLPHVGRYDYSYDGALRSLDQSLLRLGVSSVDIALVHDVDPWTHGSQAPQRQREALGGALRALSDLRSQHVIRAIGIGVNDADVAERFVREADLDVVMLAGRYSLLEQPALDRFLPLALGRGVGVMLGGVFNSGILATGAVPGAHYNYRPAPPDVVARVDAIARVCDAHGVALPHAAIAFVLGHPAVSSVVLGATTPAEVERNAAMLMRAVPPALWRDLKAARLLREDAPTPG